MIVAGTASEDTLHHLKLGDMLVQLRMQKLGADISPFFVPIRHGRVDHENEEVCAKQYIGGGLLVCVLDKQLNPVFFDDQYQRNRITQISEDEVRYQDRDEWQITWWNVDRPPMEISNFILQQRRLSDDTR
jgi:hypothetical protein